MNARENQMALSFSADHFFFNKVTFSHFATNRIETHGGADAAVDEDTNLII